MAIKLDAKTIGKKVANDAIKRTVGSTLKDTNDVLDALLGTKKTDSVSTICFPSDIRNNAQSTYMMIYIMDNNRNNVKFSNTIFNAKTDTTSFEIPAITFAKEYAKQELKNLEKAARYEIEQAKDWLVDLVTPSAETEDQKQAAAKGKSAKDKMSFWQKRASDLKSTWDFTNKWLIPKRIKSPDQKIAEELDPANNPGPGYKLVKAIALQLPDSPITYKSDYEWEAVEGKTVEMIKNLASAVENYVFGFFESDAVKDKKWQQGTNQMKAMWPDMKNAIGDAVTGGSYSGYMNAKNRMWRNPMLEFSFKAPNPRTFTYSFSFAPRNKNELYDIYNIIALLRFYSAPVMTKDNKVVTEGSSSSNWWISYPAKFSIKFFTGGNENRWMHQTLTLGLTNISETLTGENGDLAFFENYFDSGSGNPPRMINLSLTFAELGFVDRNAINVGY